MKPNSALALECAQMQPAPPEGAQADPGGGPSSPLSAAEERLFVRCQRLVTVCQ